MQHVIQLLPDAIANQIAAGEVVQRPASVIKELLENAIDAQATRIDVLIKDAGKTLIQVTDNGAGMTATDARMAFERHATSKIRSQADLMQIRTLGFRGEALASIAAVAQVKLRTRLQGEELGTEIDMEASKMVNQQACACPPGSTFQVKNLFFNVPARRNFLKSNQIETKHILNEFLRVAIPHHSIHFTLVHNDTDVYNLPPQTLEERLIMLFGDDLRGNLVPSDESTGYAYFHGFIGKPNIYRKSRGEQFFFVNGRYIKSNYLHHAIMGAYENFIPKDTYPFYVVFIDIDPVHVDINIHPTKTEVKFDDERTLYILLQGMVKRGMAESHFIPSSFNIPSGNGGSNDIYQENYSLKKENGQGSSSSPVSSTSSTSTYRPSPPQAREKMDTEAWKELYSPPKPPETIGDIPRKEETVPNLLPSQEEETFFVQQIFSRYILTRRGDKLLIIDQHLAHQRILFERFLRTNKSQRLPSQRLLFPQRLEFSVQDVTELRLAAEVLMQLGFDIQEFGQTHILVSGTPHAISNANPKEIFEQILLDMSHTNETRVADRIFSSIAQSMAKRCAAPYGKNLDLTEMKQMVSELFKTEVPAIAPNRRPVYRQISSDELKEFFTS
ncbi:MAG: DNA mismatch repair endonuclease MutL [Bacteroidota bacterium]